MVKFLGSPLEIPDAVTTTQAVRKAVTDALATRVTTLEGQSASSAGYTIVSKTAAYTAVASNFVLADATSAAFTITLPASPVTGARVAVKKVDTTTNSVTVVGSGSTTIDGDTSLILAAPKVGAVLYFDGSNWQIHSVAVFDAGGQNLTFRGTYSTSTAYAANDVVYYSGSGYVALVANTNVSPTLGASSATWNLLALSGASNTAYPAGQVISFGTDSPAANWYRAATSYVKTDGSVAAVGNIYTAHNTASQSGFGAVGPSGQMGVQLYDANLYRDNTNILKTDSSFVVGSGSGTIGTSAATAATLHLNSNAGETSLYFDQAGTAKWLFYMTGSNSPLYVRDTTNSRMQVTYTAGTTALLASTNFGSSVTVQGNLTVSGTMTGIPSGGTAGYVLAKNSATTYDTAWVSPQTLGPVRATSVSGLPTGVPLGTRGFTTDIQMDWIYSSSGGTGTWLPATPFVAYFGYASSTTQTVANNTATAMTCDGYSVVLATYNYSTGAVTLTYPGWYEFTGIVEFAAGTTGIRQAWWALNGTAIANSGNQLVPNSSAINTALPFKSHILNTPNAAQITPMVLQSNGTSLALQANSTFSSGFSIKYLGQAGSIYA